MKYSNALQHNCADLQSINCICTELQSLKLQLHCNFCIAVHCRKKYGYGYG